MTINKVLECIIDKYTLSESKFEQLEKSYNAISNWIANGVEFKEIYDVELRPQVSIALGTAILPVSKDDEVDVDLLCIIKLSVFSFVC